MRRKIRRRRERDYFNGIWKQCQNKNKLVKKIFKSRYSLLRYKTVKNININFNSLTVLTLINYSQYMFYEKLKKKIKQSAHLSIQFLFLVFHRLMAQLTKRVHISFGVFFFHFVMHLPMKNGF